MYFPNNFPVRLEERPGFVRLIQPVEATTGSHNEMDIVLDARAVHAGSGAAPICCSGRMKPARILKRLA
jgi:hypothetical protein